MALSQIGEGYVHFTVSSFADQAEMLLRRADIFALIEPKPPNHESRFATMLPLIKQMED